MNINTELIPQISENVRVREETFGLLLVSKRTPVLALDKDSMEIWNHIDGKKNVEEIAQHISSQMDADFTEIAEIVGCFVESCYDLGLIEL